MLKIIGGLRLWQPAQLGKPFFPVTFLRKPVLKGWGFFRAERGAKVYVSKSSIAKRIVYVGQKDSQSAIKKQKKAAPFGAAFST
ncbi:MAG: hypothetical protein ACKVU0_14045 [Saprospiraceae bacterium]